MADEGFDRSMKAGQRPSTYLEKMSPVDESTNFASHSYLGAFESPRRCIGTDVLTWAEAAGVAVSIFYISSDCACLKRDSSNPFRGFAYLRLARSCLESAAGSQRHDLPLVSLHGA